MISGIDLAASPRRPTGIAIGEGERIVYIGEVYGDDEIVYILKSYSVTLCGIDAPLTKDENREADKLLRKYRAMSLKVPGIKKLAERGLKLKEKLEKIGIEVVEVFPTATAKILGIYRKNKIDMLPEIEKFLDVPEGKATEHIIDALLAYYTAYLYSLGECEMVGGEIAVPLSKR